MYSQNDFIRRLAFKTIVILGFGVEGQQTLSFLRKHFPKKLIAIADVHLPDELDVSSQKMVKVDQRLCLHLGHNYLSSIINYNLIFKTPGISSDLPEISRAKSLGSEVISQTSLFFSLCKNPVVGVTGTKGKSTTTALIHTILTNSGKKAYLVGNIGPKLGGDSPLLCLDNATSDAIFIYELSSFQLEGITGSPNIAILLNIVPEHIDYHGGFEQYVRAKENITRYQDASRILIYNASSELVNAIAQKTKAKLFPYAIDRELKTGCFVSGNNIIYSPKSENKEIILTTHEVEKILPGRFNLNNVLPAIAAAKLIGVPTNKIISGIRSFHSLKDRFEYVGAFRGIHFYNAAIATVPEATIAHLETLHPKVTTVFLGGYDRGIDYSKLAIYILRKSSINTLVLFPNSGYRILDSILLAADGKQDLPKYYFVDNMEQAVQIAYKNTLPGFICLNSPASPSRGGLFKDYTERGQMFRDWVVKLGNS